MEQKKRNGHARHGKRLLGLLMALAMLGVLFMPVYATNDAESTEPAETAATVTYNFNANGEVYDTQTLMDGEELQKPADPAPTQENTTFAGWFTAADETGEEFTAFGPVTVEEDKTVDLYAHWTTEQPAIEQPADEPPAEDKPADKTTDEETPTDKETPATTPEPTTIPDTLETPDDAANEPVVQALNLNGATVEIVDNIASSGTDAGHYNVKVTRNRQDVTSQVLADENCTITWTMDGETITRKEVMDGKWTMAEDGSWVDVAYNKGAHKTFTVTVTDANEKTISTLRKNEYNDKIENGSFEIPAQDKNNKNAEFQPNIKSGTEGIVWKTTASDGLIELISTREDMTQEWNGTHTHKWMANEIHHMDHTPAGGGHQYAELNANEPGALYQDVMTAPGTTMNWSVEHNGRDGTDTMAVVIMATKDAENITTQQQLLQAIRDIQAGNYPGAQVATNLQGVQRVWTKHSGTYVVPEKQYLTRYFFVAIQTANKDSKSSVGNHIDNVWFSVDQPPLSESEARATVTKNIYGLDFKTVNEKFGNNSFMTCNGTSLIFTGWEQKKDESGTSYVTASWSTTKTVKGTGEIAKFEFIENETDAVVDGMNLSADKKSATVEVTGGHEGTVTFTNTYTPATATLTITKRVTGSLGDKTKVFTFKYSYDGEDQQGTISLTHNISETLTVPVGTTIKITETNAAGYTTTYSIDGGDAKYTEDHSSEEFTVTGDSTIVFTNNKDVDPDTGVLLDSMPYVIILIVVAAGIVGGVVLKKRKHEDDV